MQALAQAAGLSRQGALDSLRFTSGDLFAAFKVCILCQKAGLMLLDHVSSDV